MTIQNENDNQGGGSFGLPAHHKLLNERGASCFCCGDEFVMLYCRHA
jgi:hypothetical protein